MALTTRYPIFVEGQTLTDDDLNDLRSYLDDKDRTIGRLVGFGISCGLTGAVESAGLRISPGRAVDQRGEALVLEADVVLGIPPAASGVGADFVETGPGGFTVVLAAETTEVPVPECDEEGCEAHAKQETRAASLRYVPGRLTGTYFDFSTEPLLAIEPVRVRPTGTVLGAFVALRDAVASSLTGRISADALAKLRGLTVSGDLPAIQGFKAGFLNQVYFATLELLRCERLTRGGCGPGTEGTIGVALGWLHQTGTTWTWECDFRHAWQPPNGLSLALAGGRCADPCDLYRDQIDAMILAFEVPVTPPAPDEPDDGGDRPGDFPICRWTKGGYRDPDCFKIPFPPEELPDWRDKVLVRPPFPPIPPEDWRIEDYYEVDPIDFTEAGILDLIKGVGKRADTVADTLRDVIAGEGLESEIRVVTADELGGIGGYRPGTSVSVADTVVLTRDAKGKVIGTGSIPASHTLRTTSVEVPRAVAAAGRAETTAGRAETVATAARATADGLADRVEATDVRLDGLSSFQDDILTWRRATDIRLGGLNDEISAGTLDAVNNLQLEVFTRLDQRVGAAVDTVRSSVVEQLRAEIGTAVGGVKADVATDLAGVRQQVATLDGRVTSIGRDAERSNARIDEVLSRTMEPRAPGRAPEFDRDLVGLMGTMRSGIEAAATAGQRERVRAELRAGDEAFTRLEAASRAGTDVRTDPEALSSVLDSMVKAVEAAGAPATEVTRLRRDTDALMGRIR